MLIAHAHRGHRRGDESIPTVQNAPEAQVALKATADELVAERNGVADLVPG